MHGRTRLLVTLMLAGAVLGAAACDLFIKERNDGDGDDDEGPPDDCYYYCETLDDCGFLEGYYEDVDDCAEDCADMLSDDCGEEFQAEIDCMTPAFEEDCFGDEVYDDCWEEIADFEDCYG
jgi:hypothetical protein